MREGHVSYYYLHGVRPFDLEVWKWSGYNVPVNLCKMNVILSLDKKGMVPMHNFRPPRSQAWLREGKSQLAAPSGPSFHTLPS